MRRKLVLDKCKSEAKKMFSMSQRFKLFFIWFGFFLINVIVVLALCINKGDDESIRSSLLALAGIYAPYLTPIIAFWFIKDMQQHASDGSVKSYWVAIFTSILFNVIITIIVISGALKPDEASAIKNSLILASEASVILSFVVGPSIVYYFIS